VIPTTFREQQYTFIHLTDPHHRSPQFNHKLFNSFRRRVKKDPNCRVILTGDWTDDDRPSTRARRRLMGDGRPEVLTHDDQNEMAWLDKNLIPLYKDIAPKIIGVLDGDHYRVLGKMTTAQYICMRLGIPGAYLGERVGYITVVFETDSNNSMRYNILARHGVGGTGSNGSSVTAMEKQGYGWDFDLHVAGHCHRNHANVDKWCKGPNHSCSDVNWGFRAQMRGSSLLEGYEVGKTHYPEHAEYRPLTTGWAECNVTIGKVHSSGCTEVKMVKASVVAG